MAEPQSYEADIEIAAVSSIIGNRTFKFHVVATRGPDSSSHYAVTPGIPGSFPVPIIVDSVGSISAPSLSGLRLPRKGPSAAGADSVIKAVMGLRRGRARQRAGSKSGHGLRLVSTGTAAQFHQLAANLRLRATSVVEGAKEVTYTGRNGDALFEMRLDKTNDAPVFQRIQWGDGRVVELSQTFENLRGVFARVGMRARMQDGKGESTFSTTISNLVIRGAQQ